MDIIRRRRRSQRGQVIPIIAISAVALIAATALAVDLSLNTQTRRSLQNVSDSAALIGSGDLCTKPAPLILPCTSVSQTERYQAAIDALSMVHKRLQLSGSDTVFATTALAANVGSCAPVLGSSCDVNYTTGQYSVAVHSPPVLTGNTNLRTQFHVEVDVVQNAPNTFAKVFGFGSGTERGHSVAVHVGPNAPYGFALYSKTIATNGNQSEVVTGSVYVDRYINPQASSQSSGFCAAGGGLIVLGSPQFGDSGYQTKSGQYDYVPGGSNGHVITLANPTTLCDNPANVNAGYVYQTGSATSNAACTGQIVPGVTINSGEYNTNVKACVALGGIAPPVDNPPSNSGSWTTLPACTTVSAPLAHGVYRVTHASCGGNNADLNIKAPVSLPCVTFVLDSNASVYVYNQGGGSGLVTAMITPFQSAGVASPPIPTGYNISNVDCRTTDGTPATSGDGVYPFYASPNTSGQTITVDKLSTQLSMLGTLYLPNGSVTANTNSYVSVYGQAIVDSWNVQSGNQQNPDITYGGASTAGQAEELRLVE